MDNPNNPFQGKSFKVSGSSRAANVGAVAVLLLFGIGLIGNKYWIAGVITLGVGVALIVFDKRSKKPHG
ncbi:MAG: hypothetical protein HY092_00545 [Candidatus Kerfeldbacteria bacterium]|nr:hypothetical protein [Candidatus Kerfeldbacteria bacterium]